MFANKIPGLSPTGKVILEEFAGVDGKIFEEASCMVFTNGSQYVPLPFTQDHKKRFEEDKGPNTGGMGAYGPCLITKGQENWIFENVVEPSIKTMNTREPMVGCLYIALYRDTTNDDAPWGIFEYNVRPGDPEVVPLALLLKSKNFYDLCKKCADREDISDIKLKWHPGVALTTVLANKEYPNKNEAYKANLGKPIYGLADPIFNQPWCMITHAATKNLNGQIVVDGGRTLGVTTLGKDIIEAHESNRQVLKEIHCDGLSWRNDVGYRDIQRLKATA
jgi:phosphoribosylamine--glycine ligase